MDSFELNKIAGAVLFALLIIMAVNNLASLLYKSTPANPKAFVVEGLDVDIASAGITEALEEGPSLAMLLASADVATGEKVAKKCVACHSFDENGVGKIGPNLWSILGNPVAAKEGFSYSAALIELGGEWGYDNLDAFLESPRKYLPGTKMSFAGLRKARERADMIAYLRSLSDSPLPLPETPAAPPPDTEQSEQ